MADPAPLGPRPPSEPRRAAAVTARATTLADRLDHYTAERDAFDRLRNQREELEEEPTASEVLEQVKRDFQRVLTAARVNVAELFTQFGTPPLRFSTADSQLLTRWLPLAVAAAADKDGDGQVTVKEFRTGLRSLNVTVQDDMVAALVTLMDRDGDGEIDYREFTRHFSGDKAFKQERKADGASENPRLLTDEELEEVKKGFAQPVGTRNEHLLVRWSLNVDVLHALTTRERADLVQHAELITVRPGEEIVVAGSRQISPTTFFIVLSGSCCIWLPPLESSAFEAVTKVEKVALEEPPTQRAAASAQRWISVRKEIVAERQKIADLNRAARKAEAEELAAHYGAEWYQSAGRQRRRQQHRPRGKTGGGRRSRRSPKRVYVPGKGYRDSTQREHLGVRERWLHDHEPVLSVFDGVMARKKREDEERAKLLQTDNRTLDEVSLGHKAQRLSGPLGGETEHRVEMLFPPYSSFGELRAFHNAEAASVLREGTKTVQMTVRATMQEDVSVLLVNREEDIAAVMAAYRSSLDDKVAFLQTLQQYQNSGEDAVRRLASFMRRVWVAEGDTVVIEGEEADAVYFVMSGQLRVSKCQPDGKMGVVNVLGAGTSFGQMGCVQKDGKRGASCVALTNCELLCIHRYNFVRSSDPEGIPPPSPPFLGRFTPVLRRFSAVLLHCPVSWRRDGENGRKVAENGRKFGEKWARNSGG